MLLKWKLSILKGQYINENIKIIYIQTLINFYPADCLKSNVYARTKLNIFAKIAKNIE